MAQRIRRDRDRPGLEAQELEKENGRLKKLVADLAPDNAILKETVRGNF
jgi:hypothetical protein